jgi:lysine decarboxylase
MTATSMHKTGGSLTQSSVLLTKGPRNNYEYIRTALNILSSTSPSSLLIASIDVARKEMALHGAELTSHAIKMRNYVVDSLKNLKRARVLDEEYFKSKGVFDYDTTRLVVSFKDCGMTGFYAYHLLREKYNIQAEMGEKFVVLFIFTGGTTLEDANRLISAVTEMDTMQSEDVFDDTLEFMYAYPEYVVRPREAFHAPKKYVHYLDALNEISAESIMIYPPGIPLVIMGERIDENVIKTIKFYMIKGFTILKDSSGSFIKVIDTEKWIKRSDDDEI